MGARRAALLPKNLEVYMKIGDDSLEEEAISKK